jgi:hypothetical protein
MIFLSKYLDDLYSKGSLGSWKPQNLKIISRNIYILRANEILISTTGFELKPCNVRVKNVATGPTLTFLILCPYI